MKPIRQLAAFAIAAIASTAGCAEQQTQAPEDVNGNEVESLGGLSLPLTSTDSRGRTYRLRNATFTIALNYWSYDGGRGDTTVLSSETDPNADRLTARLVPGSYMVALGGDWYIERLTSSGAERVQQVVPLTELTQYVYVDQYWSAQVDFRFGVDGELIDFRHGDLNIDISIELPGENDDAGPFPGYDASVWFVDGGVLR